MKLRTGLTLAIILVVTAIGFALGCSQSSASMSESPAPEVSATPSRSSMAAANDAVFDGVRLERAEDEWKKLLTPAQYTILREEGTDYPFESQYHDHKAKGDYYCAACHLKVFSSAAKYDSGTGWPSFWQPANEKNVVEKEDRSEAEVRTEIECARCGSHLGHVFDDGPKPTGLRYCINGTALKFEKAR
ncbi:MAG: peptide-methionine (R)-S-oxide reductase MsrB [Pyrinomonadaceae bacterium]